MILIFRHRLAQGGNGVATMFNMRQLYVFSLVLLLLTGAGCSTTHEYKGTKLDPPIPVPDFELTADSGQPFRMSETNGNIKLVFFGYTFCPDVCPLTLSEVRQALAKLDPAQRERVDVLFISADPERDTPEVLDRYLSNFDPTYIGLTDDFEKIQEVMKPFGASAQKEVVENSTTGYLVSHTARLYLLNPNNEILMLYPFGFPPEDLASDISALLAEGV